MELRWLTGDDIINGVYRLCDLNYRFDVAFLEPFALQASLSKFYNSKSKDDILKSLKSVSCYSRNDFQDIMICFIHGPFLQDEIQTNSFENINYHWSLLINS